MARLGVAPRFVLRAHDFSAPDALRPAPRSAATATPAVERVAEVESDEMEEAAIDLGDLVDAHDAAPSDSVARLMSDFGAEVVEERPRE